MAMRTCRTRPACGPAISPTRETRARQIANSCMGACLFAGERLVQELPSRARLLRRHFLNRVADMHQNEIAAHDRLVLQQEQTHLSLDTLSRTPGPKALNRY